MTAGEALALITKRAHGAGIVVEDGRPVGVVTERDLDRVDRFTQVLDVMSADPMTLSAGADPRAAFDELHRARRRVAPVVDADGRLVGIQTTKGAVRASMYTPAVDAQGRLRIAAAVGINGDVGGKAAALLAAAGVPVLPCVPGAKNPLLKPDEENPEAQPGGFHAATIDARQVAAWWRRWPSANIGIPTGAVSGVVVVDVDRKPGGDGFAAFERSRRAGLVPGWLAAVRSASGDSSWQVGQKALT